MDYPYSDHDSSKLVALFTGFEKEWGVVVRPQTINKTQATAIKQTNRCP